MKKKLLLIFLGLALVLGGCSKKTDTKGEDTNKITIGVSPVPHGEIAEMAKEELAKEGIDLEIKIFDDYVLPNKALGDGSISANFFQHLPYLEKYNEENKTNFVSLGQVHVEPIALYSTKVKKLEDLKEGAEILIPADASNGARALFLLEKSGLIKLKDGLGAIATEQDIVENTKKVKFTPVEAAILTRAYKDVDGAIINSNYALSAGLNPSKDGLIMESTDSKYANIIAVKKEDLEKDTFKKLINAFQSDSIKKYLEEKYKGEIIPAFN